MRTRNLMIRMHSTVLNYGSMHQCHTKQRSLSLSNLALMYSTV